MHKSLASKRFVKSKNKMNSVLPICMISMYWFKHFLDARAEIRDLFSLDFERILDTIMSFWNFLTFRCDVTPHQTKVDKLFRTTTLCISCRTSGPDEWWYVQVNNYEIVVLFFHISHNLTWYSAIVHKFTSIYPVFSTNMNWQNNSYKFV